MSVSSVVTLSDRVAFIESVFGAGKLARNSLNIEVRCPICDPRDPTKKKLAIRTDDDRTHCWVCGYKSYTLAPLIRKFSTQAKMSEYRDRFMRKDLKNVRYDDVVTRAVELPRDFRLLATASDHDPDVVATWRYAVTTRHMSDRDLWYFKAGVSDDPRWRRRIIVPSFDAEGNLNYFVARAIDSGRRPKYDNPDVNRLPIVFNELNVDWTKRLVLCEGAFDMFKCGDNAVPILGSELDERYAVFNLVLVNNTPVALALDGDVWETKTPKIAKKLIEYGINVVLVDTRPFGDPGSASKEQFEEALDRAVEPTWSSMFNLKLSRASRTSLSIR